MALSVIFTTSGTLRHISGALYAPTLALPGAVTVPISTARGVVAPPNQPAGFFCFTGATADRPAATTQSTGGVGINSGQDAIYGSLSNPVISNAIPVPPIPVPFGTPFYDTSLSKMISFCGFVATSTGWCDQTGASV
jgi:hypothetical protein